MKYKKIIYAESIFTLPFFLENKKKEVILTNKEMDILKNMAKGFTSQEIANIECRSYYTVTTHIRNIYKKLSVNSRAEAIFKACENEIL